MVMVSLSSSLLETHFPSSKSLLIKPLRQSNILFPFPPSTSPKFLTPICQQSKSPDNNNNNLSLQLQPLQDLHSNSLLLHHPPNTTPNLIRKPKSTWVNPSRPRRSVLSLQRHKRVPYSLNPNLKQLTLFLNKLNNSHDEDEALISKLLLEHQPVTKQDALLILNGLKTWNKSILFFNWLKHHNNGEGLFSADTLFYNVVMKSLKNGRRWDELERLAQDMIDQGIELDNVTYSTIITCAKKCGFFDKAIQWFDRMYQFGGCMPDEVTYSAVLDVYAKLGRIEDVLTLYERGRADGWEPDVVAFSVLGKMFGLAGDYDGIQFVFKEMSSVGVKPNLVLYNTLLEALGKAGKPGLARSLFNHMVVDSGVTPNEITLTLLVKMYGKARWGKDALMLWEKMKEKKWPVDFMLYNTLLSMCADLGLEQEAESLFNDMRMSENCKPDSWSYTALLNIYTSGEKVEKAYGLFEEMLGYDDKLNIMGSTCLIQCLGRSKRIDDVVRVFGITVERGIVPDDRLCGCLLSVVALCEEDEDVRKVLGCLESVNPGLVGFVKQIGNDDVSLDVMKAELRGVLTQASVEVRRPFCNCLIDICYKMKYRERAHELLYLGTLFGLYPELQARSDEEWSLNLRCLSLGAALTAVDEWMRALVTAVKRREALPQYFAINTGVGAHKFSKGLGSSLESHLKRIYSPFQKNERRVGWFVASQEEIISWAQSPNSSSLITS